MQKIHFTKQINASREKVWDTMLNDATYRIWTEPFSPGSYYEGNWDQGSEIRFKGNDENGNPRPGGMYAQIKENRKYEFISIEHLGMIKEDGTVDTESEEVKKWTPAFENYTFNKDLDGGTEVSVDCDVNDEWKEMLENAWPKALDILKELSEK